MPRNPAGAVYGTITVGTSLAAEDTRRETYGQTLASAALGLLVIVLRAVQH